MKGAILIVEDEPTTRTMLCHLIEKQFGYPVIAVTDGETAMNALKRDAESTISLMLLDLMLPDTHGLEVLRRVTRDYPDLPAIILTGSTRIHDAVAALKIGAVDFLTKPFEPERLRVSIANALRLQQLAREVDRLQRERAGATAFGDIVGYDSGLKNAVHIGQKAAQTGVPVLISGETGTGKELFARAIHSESPRRDAPFITVNCGAIPENLVESTLFGHEKGAFTGAVSKSSGKFRDADGGTLFLDEIGELPLGAQVKLLRALQQKEVEPVGGGKPVPVDVRVISATHRALAEEVRAGRFREDLIFRLNVVPLHIPPLRERRQDILALAGYFIDRFSASEKLPIRRLSSEAADCLLRHPWPGNVRELANALHRAMVLGEGQLLTPKDFADLGAAPAMGHAAAGAPVPGALRLFDDRGALKHMEAIEREIIRFAIDYCGQNIAQAAASLGIAKSTFYRRVKERP